MKTTFSFTGLGFGALLVALAPACTVTVSDDDDTTTDPAQDAGDSTDVSDEDGTTNADVSTEDAGATDTDSDEDSGSGTSADAGDETTGSIDVTLDPATDGGVPDDGGVAAPGRNGCGDDVSDAAIVTGAISDDVTWSGVVKVEGAVTLQNGSSLTIEPGTHIIMAVDSSIEVGWNSGGVTLNASGTAEEPIVLCGESEERGFWESFIVGNNVTSNSTLRHVRMFDGGGSDADAALQLGASIIVDNLLVSNSESAGVAAIDFEEESARLSVTDSERSVILLGDGAATNFPVGGEFTTNEEMLARVRFTTVTADLVFPNVGIPYLQEANLQIRDGGSVEFNAGVEYQFDTDTTLEVGWNSGSAEIQVGGTEDEPVVFRGREQEPGYWGGIIIGNNVLSSSSLNYLELQHGGGDDRYALEIEAEVEINHVSLVDNEQGVAITGQGLGSSSTTLNVTGTESYPITVEPEALITLPTGGDLTGNDTDQIRVLAGNYTVEGTVPNLGVPYRIEGELQTRADSSMTIAAGTEFVMASDSRIVVGWNSGSATFVAEGTMAEPIRFSGDAEEAGSWMGLVIENNVLSASALRWVEFAHAGGDGFVLELNTPMTIENCSFSDYDGVAILKLSSDTNDYTENDNIFTGDAVADL